jgi:2-methylisocitrate lyase-like PEP mutase family enzyme
MLFLQNYGLPTFFRAPSEAQKQSHPGYESQNDFRAHSSTRTGENFLVKVDRALSKEGKSGRKEPLPWRAVKRVAHAGKQRATERAFRLRILNMNDGNAAQQSAVTRFRALHESGCFVLPNPWDVGTAVYLHHLGFKALATTSAGVAFARGRPDATPALPHDEMLTHIREIAAATPLPVNADFQSGYADEPEGVAANVALCIATGTAGLSIEDNTGNAVSPLYETNMAIERIRAARNAIDASGIPVVLTGRCEAWLVGEPDPFRVALDRLVAYAEAGADCLYAPGVREPDEIAAIVKAVSPKPVNVLMHGPSATLSVSRLADLGVRRVSVGSALARVAWGAFIRSAQSIAATGTFDSLADAAPFAEINDVFSQRS